MLKGLFGFRRKVKRCCATCSALAHSVCIEERYIASHSMRPFPKDGDELRRRYVCSDWHVEESLEEVKVGGK